MKRALDPRSWRMARALGVALLVGGCELGKAPMLDPKGPIALAERDLMFAAVAFMLIVVIPVFCFAFWFAWRYRASDTEVRKPPRWTNDNRIDVVIWLVPAVIVMVLGVLLWTHTHRLDPYKPLASGVPAIEVEVVAQDWKWLFIYPEQKIAVVNQLVFPAGAPLSLRITSDTVMNSFFIPALGGQIYAMPGMQTRLQLLADEPGHFTGKNVQYSGRGFADQNFEAIAATGQDFDAWVAKVKRSPNKLDATAYRDLAAPSEKHKVTYYSTVEPNLFDKIIIKYAPNWTQGEEAIAK